MGDRTLQETCSVVAMGEAKFFCWMCHLHGNLDDLMRFVLIRYCLLLQVAEGEIPLTARNGY